MRYMLIPVLFALSACSSLNLGTEPPIAPMALPQDEVTQDVGIRPLARPIIVATDVPVNIETATGKPEVSSKTLGTTVASLGNPAEPGVWMKTPLVSTEQQGEVTAAGGAKLIVTLIPLPGPATGASQLSLQAMQALGIPLTALPEVAVNLL